MRRDRSFYNWEMKTFKLKELSDKLEEMRTTPGINDNTLVKINIGGYDDIISIKSVCIASEDYVGDYISIETELSKWE